MIENLAFISIHSNYPSETNRDFLNVLRIRERGAQQRQNFKEPVELREETFYSSDSWTDI